VVEGAAGPAVEVRMMMLSGLSSCVELKVVAGGCPGGAGGVTWAGASGGAMPGTWIVPVGSGSSGVRSTLPGVKGWVCRIVRSASLQRICIAGATVTTSRLGGALVFPATPQTPPRKSVVSDAQANPL